MQSLNIIFSEAGRVELREQPVRTVGPGQLLCAAQRSLVSTGTETRCLRGGFEPGSTWDGWVKYPFHPGYSMVARVLEAGPGAGMREGDRVAVSTPHRQFFVTDAADALRVPDDISDEDATWLFLGCTTQLAVRRAAIELGEQVGVVGLGLLGQLIVQYLAIVGARRVVAVNRRPERVELARRLGATHGVAGDLLRDGGRVEEEVRELTGGRMLDAAFDVSGSPGVLAEATRLARRLGRVVLVGDSVEPGQLALGPRALASSLAVLAVHGSLRTEPASAFYPWGEAALTEVFFDFVRQGRLRVAELVSRRAAPAEAPDVYAELLSARGAQMATIFDWTSL